MKTTPEATASTTTPDKVTQMKKRTDVNIRFYGATQHATIKRAAKTAGLSVNEFMVTAALDRAKSTISRRKKAS
jgi:uncharacterized protein (DUF1778 family)